VWLFSFVCLFTKRGVVAYPLGWTLLHRESFQALMASFVPRAMRYMTLRRLETGCSSISSSVILTLLIWTPSSSRACLLRRDQLESVRE